MVLISSAIKKEWMKMEIYFITAILLLKFRLGEAFTQAATTRGYDYYTKWAPLPPAYLCKMPIGNSAFMRLLHITEVYGK